MIDITYIRAEDWTLIDISGHAGYADAGQDIVCAGVSALTYTLIDAAEKARENGAYADITVEAGHVHIVTQCGENHNYALDAIFSGIKLLHSQYPEYITVVTAHAVT